MVPDGSGNRTASGTGQQREPDGAVPQHVAVDEFQMLPVSLLHGLFRAGFWPFALDPLGGPLQPGPGMLRPSSISARRV